MFKRSFFVLLAVCAASAIFVALLETPLTAKWQTQQLMGGYQKVRYSHGDWVESYVYDDKGRLRVHNWIDFQHVNHSIEYDVETGKPIGEQVMTQSR